MSIGLFNTDFQLQQIVWFDKCLDPKLNECINMWMLNAFAYDELKMLCGHYRMDQV